MTNYKHGFGCKLMAFSEASKTVQVMDALPSFSSDELGIRRPCDSFRSGVLVPQCFLLMHAGATYLINTEGYDYCRYVAKARVA
jgi:hypothetical protein